LKKEKPPNKAASDREDCSSQKHGLVNDSGLQVTEYLFCNHVTGYRRDQPAQSLDF